MKTDNLKKPPQKPLPKNLAEAAARWQTGAFKDAQEHYETLAAQGQSPQALVISCCDSRVHAMAVFCASAGDLFIHRNVANIVPPASNGGVALGTGAALEHAVKNLAVPHIIVMGHSGCAGVRACYDKCASDAPSQDKSSFVSQWVEILRPAYMQLAKDFEEMPIEQRLRELEQASVLLSLENLMSFDFVRARVEAGELELHATWLEIKTGQLVVL